jgi:hypothetical protein
MRSAAASRQCTADPRIVNTATRVGRARNHRRARPGYRSTCRTTPRRRTGVTPPPESAPFTGRTRSSCRPASQGCGNPWRRNSRGAWKAAVSVTRHPGDTPLPKPPRLRPAGFSSTILPSSRNSAVFPDTLMHQTGGRVSGRAGGAMRSGVGRYDRPRRMRLG